MKTLILKALVAGFLISTSQIAPAVGEPATNTIERWQMKMIYQPGQSTLDREARGFVHIYDGFSDTQVDKILDQKFKRIEHMMFTRVKITNPAGVVLKDPETGDELVEDDGCE